MKKIRLFIVSAVVAVLTAACGDSLADKVEMAASHCPVMIDNVGFIKDICLDGDTLVYDCTVTNSDIDIPGLRSQADRVKSVIAPQLPELFRRNSELLDAMLDKGVALAVRYTDGAGNRMSVGFSAGELREIIERGAHEMSPEERLAAEIEISRASLPVEMTVGMTMVGISDENGMVVFDCEVDESVAGHDAIDNLRGNRGAIADDMLASLTSRENSDVNTLVSLTTAAGRGIAYRYRGSVSGDTMMLSFTPGQLARRPQPQPGK